MIKRTFILFLLSAIFAALIITSLFGLVEINSEATMDSLTYYNSDTFYHNLEILGSEGRNAYLILHGFDYVFMIVFMLFLVSAITLLRKNSLSILEKFTYLPYLPLLSFICDFTENISIDLSILIYPRKFSAFGFISGYATATKMYTLYIIFIIIALMLVMKFLLMIGKKGNN